jgi:hypothetical protein
MKVAYPCRYWILPETMTTLLFENNGRKSLIDIVYIGLFLVTFDPLTMNTHHIKILKDFSF